eukprot:1145898-Pelagomonas_calceolata.AAC.1
MAGAGTTLARPPLVSCGYCFTYGKIDNENGCATIRKTYAIHASQGTWLALGQPRHNPHCCQRTTANKAIRFAAAQQSQGQVSMSVRVAADLGAICAQPPLVGWCGR